MEIRTARLKRSSLDRKREAMAYPIRVQVDLSGFAGRAQVRPLPQRGAAGAAARGALHPRAGGAVRQRGADVEVERDGCGEKRARSAPSRSHVATEPRRKRCGYPSAGTAAGWRRARRRRRGCGRRRAARWAAAAGPRGRPSHPGGASATAASGRIALRQSGR